MGNQLDRKRKLRQPTSGLPTDDPLLVYIIETGYGLLDELHRSGVLNRQQVELIDGERTRVDAVRRLLDEIKRKSLGQQELFLSALDKTKQSHVSDYILNNGQRPSNRDSDNWPIYGYSRWGRIEQKWVQLKDSIDFRNSGLLDELLSAHCISRRHRNFLAEQTTHAEVGNELLLTVIRGRSFKDYYKFIDCLTKTKQHQAVALLEPERYTSEKPVSRRQQDTLTANHSALVELIDVKRCGLASRLLSADVITRRQKECIESAVEPSESNRRLLAIVKRGSKRDFNKLVECLGETGQQQIADLLSGDGVVAEMAVQTSLSQTDEIFIAEQFFSLSRRTTPDQKASWQRVFGEFSEALRDCQLVAMKFKRGLEIVILCKSLSGLLMLSEMHSTKRLESVVSRIISFLLDNRTPNYLGTVPNLVWRLSNYNVCVQHLSNLSGLSVYAQIHRLYQQQSPDSTASATTSCLSLPIDKFPHELVELSLIKATVSLFIVTTRMTSRADVHAMTTLLGVCRYWWDTLTYRNRNKSLLKQYVRHATVSAGFRFNPKPLTVLQFGKNRRIKGVAEYNGKLYVVASGSNTIDVLTIVGSSYHDNSGERIEIAELMEPGDVVACRATGCLFVSDSATRCLWRVNLLDEQLNVRKVSKFITTGYVPFTLSVRSGRLFVTELYGTAVHVYSCQDGEPITLADKVSVHYMLPEYMLAYHAVSLSDGTTLTVCHRNRTIGDAEAEHRPGVCEVSADGLVIRRYKNAEELHDPEYVTVGDSRKHVLVCDRLNQRLVRLNSDLSLEQVVLTKGELRGQPWRLCYSEERRVLYVCYCDQPVADVYCV